MWPTSGRSSSNSRRRPERVTRANPPAVSLVRCALAACGDRPAARGELTRGVPAAIEQQRQHLDPRRIRNQRA